MLRHKKTSRFTFGETFILFYVPGLRISCCSPFYFLFDMICMSLDLIFISKRAINFHPFISIRVNGITFHCSGQPRTVTSSHKYAAPKKDKKAKLNPFLIKRFKRNSKLKMIIIYFYRYHL